VVDLGADGLIAVSAGAGGHAGTVAANVLLPMLKSKFKIPVIAAGGIVDGQGLASALALGADGVSVGTRFIASVEAPVTDAYKQAILKSHAEDIVYTSRISGTPCSVIRTPYIEKIGLQQNWFERTITASPRLKKYMKMLTQYRGMKLLEKAAFSVTYQNVWCAGQSSELISEIKTIREILNEFVTTYQKTVDGLPKVSV
jgi:nitronate monooxygenase